MPGSADLGVDRVRGRRASASCFGVALKSPDIDGSLPPWDEVKQRREWDALLIGNALSRSVWSPFACDSLLKEAQDARALAEDDLRLFQELATSSFERVLSALATAIRIEEPLERDTSQLLERYTCIQGALGTAVRSIHLPWRQVPTRTLRRVRAAMREVRFLFTTSYDLLLYWAAAEGRNPAFPFYGIADYFWSPGSYGRCEFDPGQVSIRYHDWTRLFFLHGALHLVAMPSGKTLKRTSHGQALLDEFGEPFAGEQRARPLMISEGDAVDKNRAIQENAYLTFAMDHLRREMEPLVVFGQSLSEQDRHVVEALDRPGRPLAIALEANESDTGPKKREIAARLPRVDELHFFDAATHPLGDARLRLPSFKVWRFRLARMAKRVPTGFGGSSSPSR
jgi:Domain of unknown function (DUF4917)